MTTATEIFEVRNQETAPAASRELLNAVHAKMGFVPNLLGTLANSPVALQSYLSLSDVFDQSSFSAEERQLILLAASVENNCDYCVPAHSTILKRMLKADPETIAAVRTGRTLQDSRLDALVAFTREVVRERGRVTASTVERVLDAGFGREQLLEVLVGVSLKTISNYLDHLAPVELDSAFAAER